MADQTGGVAPRSMHFISGLPRSGSTLLAALLRQNPRFQAGMSSALFPLVASTLSAMTRDAEIPWQMEERQRPIILRALCEAYYQSDPAAVVFDTNRGWCSRMPLLRQLYPGAKVIACVRNVSWIMDSLERLYRGNPFDQSRMFPPESQATVYSRVEYLGRRDSLVGFSWAALKEAFYGEQADALLVVDYELLAQAPEKVLRLIYAFIGEPYYEGHDFDTVDYTAELFDAALGIKGLHTVRPKVRFEPRSTILPPDLFEKFAGMEFWADLTASKASVVAPKKAPPEPDKGATKP